MKLYDLILVAIACILFVSSDRVSAQRLSMSQVAGSYDELDAQVGGGRVLYGEYNKGPYKAGAEYNLDQEEADVEWDCATTTHTGTFTRSNDCTISGKNHVDVFGTLEIDGSRKDMNHLITITAARYHRHFSLIGGKAKLTLRYLKLVGGNVRYNRYGERYPFYGGSILILTNLLPYPRLGGELNLYSSIVYNNKAIAGGGIYADGDDSDNKNVKLNIYDSIIKNNEAGKYSGGIYMYAAVGTIHNSKIDNNLAKMFRGGGISLSDSDVTIENTIISNNKVIGVGGGLYISQTFTMHTERSYLIGYTKRVQKGKVVVDWNAGDTTVILRQTSFINNDASKDGDEIITVGSPTMSLINTDFNNPNTNIDIYAADGPPKWKTCSNNLCTETPFTGTCRAADTISMNHCYHNYNSINFRRVTCDFNANTKLGVICPTEENVGTAPHRNVIENMNQNYEKVVGTDD